MRLKFFASMSRLARRIPRPPEKITALACLTALFAFSFFAGQTAAWFTLDQQTASSALLAASDGNWGLSFQTPGLPPAGNATSDYLKEFRACYLGSPGQTAHGSKKL